MQQHKIRLIFFPPYDPFVSLLLFSSDHFYSVFLADSDKFEKSALLKLADVNEAVTFVTDSGLRKEILELYQENGIEMIRGEQKQ